MNEFFKKNYFIIKLLELILDFLFIIISFFIGIQISASIRNGNFFESFKDIFLNLFSGNLAIVKTQFLYFFLNLIFFNIYQSFATNKRYKETVKSVFLALFMANATAILLAVMFETNLVRPTTIIYIFISQLTVFCIYKYIFSLSIRKINKRYVLIVGEKEEAIRLSIKFLHKSEKGKHLKYILFEENKKLPKDLSTYLDVVDIIIVTHNLSEKNKNNIVNYCLSKKHKTIYLVPKLYETSILNSKVNQVDDVTVFESSSMHLSLTQRFVKRSFDLVFSTLMFIVSSPVLLIVSLIIKLSDKGPVFYKQERITRDNKTFILYKFRTMIVNAEEHTGPVWQLEDDPRITKVGRILRKTRLDELPQLINVIKSEMSLIGPRPEREYFINEFMKDIPDFKYRINVKPGITGLAQVNGKYNSEPVDKLRFDLIYIKKYSLWLDIKILFLTIKAIFDRDSSATLGLPKLEDLLVKKKIITTPIEQGFEVSRDEKG